MKKIINIFTLVLSTIALSGIVSADENRTLIINEELKIVTRVAAPADSPLDEIRSGWTFRKKETQDLEMDDYDNPSFIFVDQGAALWNKVEGTNNKSCASCHNDVESMKGLRTELPRWNAAKNDIYTMEEYINDCRTERMGAEAWKWSKGKMTAITSLISLQSRGMELNVSIDGPAAKAYELGKEIYYTRVGQLDMSCANCHEDYYGVMIRADHLSQGQINGFPTYRLKNAKMNSIHARFKGCMKNIRATPYKEGSDEFKALELYVSSRGAGLSVESPSVRN
jgi:sulfur-oxidizing protein SoxA